MNIELFGFKKKGDHWATPYLYTNNITNKYYELWIIDDEYILKENQNWVESWGASGSTKSLYKGYISDEEHLFNILVENGVDLPEINRHIKLKKILE